MRVGGEGEQRGAIWSLNLLLKCLRIPSPHPHLIALIHALLQALGIGHPLRLEKGTSHPGLTFLWFPQQPAIPSGLC